MEERGNFARKIPTQTKRVQSRGRFGCVWCDLWCVCVWRQEAKSGNSRLYIIRIRSQKSEEKKKDTRTQQQNPNPNSTLNSKLHPQHVIVVHKLRV